MDSFKSKENAIFDPKNDLFFEFERYGNLSWGKNGSCGNRLHLNDDCRDHILRCYARHSLRHHGFGLRSLLDAKRVHLRISEILHPWEWFLFIKTTAHFYWNKTLNFVIWEFIYRLTRRMNLEEERRESAQCEDDKAKKVYFYQNHFYPFLVWVWVIWTSFIWTRHQFVGLL